MSSSARIKHILAIDWDAHTLRVVQADLGKRGPKIQRILSAAVPAGVNVADSEQMGAHLRRVLDQEGISTRYAIADIPRDQVILNTLTLPITAPEERPGMVAIQVAKELPFAAVEAVIDFAAPIVEEGATTTSVLVAAIRREVVQHFQSIFAAAGLKLVRLGLRPYAHAVAVCALLKHAMPERVLFIDVRPALTEIDVLRDSTLSFSRAASVLIPEQGDRPSRLSIAGREETAPLTPPEPERPRISLASTVSSADGSIEALVVEVIRSIEAYRATDPQGTIDHAVIGGDLGVEERLAESIQKRLGVTTELYNPAASFGWEPDEGAAASAFAGALGLVLTLRDDTEKHFDFLHPKKSESVSKRRLRKAPAIAAVIALFVGAAAVGLDAYTKPKRKRLTTMESQINTFQGNVRENGKFLKLVAQIQAFDEDQHVWVDVLRDVVSALPSNKELVVEQLEMKQAGQKSRGRVELKTRTKTAVIATDTIRRLNAFRRADTDKPRFHARMGTQAENAGERYRYTQELRIDILDDGHPVTRVRVDAVPEESQGDEPNNDGPTK